MDDKQAAQRSKAGLRLSTRLTPQLHNLSENQPPTRQPMMAQISGIDASTPVRAMLTCCCISR